MHRGGDGFRLCSTAFSTLAPYTLNWLESQEMRSKLRARVGQTRFDLIYFDTISLAVYAGDVGATPKVLNHHNIESDMMYRRSS